MLHNSDAEDLAKGAPAVIVDLDHSPVVLLNHLSNRLAATGSATYRHKFGLGIADIRLLIMLANEPDIGPSRVSEVIGLDTAQISKALQVLKKRALVKSTADPRHPRYARWSLTQQGAEIQDEVATIAIARSRALMEGVPLQDQETCLNVLRKMLENVKQFPRTQAAGEAETR